MINEDLINETKKEAIKHKFNGHLYGLKALKDLSLYYEGDLEKMSQTFELIKQNYLEENNLHTEDKELNQIISNVYHSLASYELAHSYEMDVYEVKEKVYTK